MTVNISQVAKKTALILSNTDLVKDPYHNEIKNAAYYLVATGRESFVYCGQNILGSTSWTKDSNSILIAHNEALGSLV